MFCCNWLTFVSSFSISRSNTRIFSHLHSINDNYPSVSLDIHTYNDTSGMIHIENLAENESKISSRILGFYPFPNSPPRGPLGWLLKDTHQAIIVTETMPRVAVRTSESRKLKSQKTSVRMDFMTRNGTNHPVWYNEIIKWNVLLGGSIDGEVRVKVLGTKTQRKTTNSTNEELKDDEVLLLDSSKLKRLIAYANDYDCQMNLYGNNCRMFAARMEREVIRINLEGKEKQDLSHEILLADLHCALRIMWAAILPSLYPLGAIFCIYEGCFMAS